MFTNRAVDVCQLNTTSRECNQATEVLYKYCPLTLDR